MNIIWGKKGKRMLSLLMAFMVITLQFNGLTFAEGSVVAPSTLAEWKYTSNPTDLGIFPASDGVYKETSTLQPVPSAPYYDWNDDIKAIRYQGWHQETGKDKYWLTVVPTKNYKNITLSSALQGKGTTGPRDFRVQISTDQQNWLNITGEGTDLPDLVLNPDTATPLIKAPLPDTANNQDKLYIRWLVNSNVSTSGSTIGDQGSSQLINITVEGELKGTEPPSDTTPPTPPVDLAGSAVSDSTINLTWMASDDVGTTGYHIYRDGSKISSTVATSYDDAGVIRDTTYRYHVIAYDSANNNSDISNQIEVTTKSAASLEKTKLAEWIFANAGQNGVFPATDGTFKTASTFRSIGGYYEDYDSSQQAISYQGWDGSNGKKYWLATVSTKGYDNLTLSSQQNSSGTGPRDFKVQISTNNNTWSDVPNTNLKMVVSSFNCASNTCKLVDVPLPANANNQDLLYIRWIVSSDANTKDGKSIGSTGSSRIKDVRVSGSSITGGPVEIPTVELAKAPKDGVTNVTQAAPVTVTFNKAVSVNPGYSVTIVDKSNKPLGSVTSEIVNNDTLNIKHPSFVSGQTYTVKVPKELIKGKNDQVMLANDISWSFTIQGGQSTPSVPKLINMTFNGDSKTTRAFTWYTDVLTSSVVQVVEASKVQGSNFPEDEALVFGGSAEEIQTYITKADRTGNKKKKFISHKVIANNLTPGTVYKYRVGSGSSDSWSSIGSFQTDTTSNQPFHFIAGSDSQASSKSGFEPWADTFRKAVETVGNPKFLINAGDLVDNGDLEEQWQWMLGLPQNQLLNVPIVPVLGGHEVKDYDGDETTANSNFYNHFNLPKKVIANTDDGSVYSFEYGDALILVFNSQYGGELASNGKDVKSVDPQFTAQVEWMKHTVAKSNAKWKFVTFHKGPYSAGDNAGEWEDDRVQFYRKILIPTFDEMGIDMVFEAHDHMYMRSFQMLGDKTIPTSQLSFDNQGNAINPKGTVYLMSNSFGDKFYEKYPGYNDYFAAINNQPHKKMFTDVSVSSDVLQFTAYTAAKKDEKAGDNGVKVYDHYGIKRTDTKPAKVEGAKVQISGNKAVISWKAPAAGGEPVRGFRIYEKNDKVKAFWSAYVPSESGKMDYTLTVNNINTATKYDFVVRAVGTRINSDPVEVSTP
ncbi:metallophosphoesterase [Paenibacillus sp. IHBB 10380]|uniref:metallophosphoesterase n=1 Tax=Paenibacillus sp. IHBB 10380 TaxID=1566358 RepID=UPI0009E46A52|nr:fibronectin type III domain-containing protein [Paenibacillus sp. IHBB 10380]